MAYKLLALDMDGTLLNSQKKISPKTAAAIAELSRSGINVVLSTGRGVAELADYKAELKFMHYGVTISGGLVFDFFTNKPVVAHPVAEDLMLKIIDAALEERAIMTKLGISAGTSRLIENYQEANQVYQDMYNRICERCDDFKAYIHAHPNEIIKVNVYHRTPESMYRNLERLKDLPLTFAIAETTALECSPRGISKASGLRELCDFLKIDISETVAVGDAPNDIEILKTAGVAAVMGNASDDIKKLADFVTADNDHDGIVKVIEKYF